MKRLLSFILTFITAVCLTTANASDKLTLMLDANIKPEHAPLLTAKEMGFFKEQNLTVDILTSPSHQQTGKATADKRVDLGIIDQPYLIGQIDQGVPLISIGTLIDKPLDSLVVLSDEHIHTIKDLKGKRIASSGSVIDTVMLKAMLHYHGLSDRDVSIIKLNSNPAEALLTHKADAVNHILRNHDNTLFETKNKQHLTFLPEENGIPTYSVMIFATHRNNIHDSRFPRFLAAIKKAVAWIDQHPEEGWKMFVKNHPDLNNAVNRETWFATMPYYAEEPSEFDEKDWRQFAKFMHENKMIQRQLPTSEYAIVVN